MFIMKKYIVIILSIIITHSHAMEMETKTEKKDYIPWYAIYRVSLFSMLPGEILSHIASFLTFDDFETEEEFIERTKILNYPKSSYGYYDYLHCLPSTKGLDSIAIVHCPNNKIVSLYARFQIYTNTGPLIMIIDRKNKTPLHTIDMRYRRYKTAISRGGNLLGDILYEKSDSYKKITLTITNITVIPAAKTELGFCVLRKHGRYKTNSQISRIPNSFELFDKHPTIFFNKQGTQLIMWGKDHTKLNDVLDKNAPVPCHYQIFPVTVNTAEPDTDYKRTFTKYLKQRDIFEGLS